MDKYRARKTGKWYEKDAWIVERRRWFFFHQPLRSARISSFSGSSKLFIKRNIVISFDNEKEAVEEAKFLNSGGKPIKVVCCKNGKAYLVTRKLDIDKVLLVLSGSFKRRNKKEC